MLKRTSLLLIMCEYSLKIIQNSKKTDKPWKPIYNYLIKRCDCESCQLTYKKITASIRIRKLFRRKLKSLNNNSRILKSISDKDIDVRQKIWMLPLTDDINDLQIVSRLF